MDFKQRLQEGLNKGISVSKDLFGKAKDKAQDLGEKGVLKIEIMQLEDQAGKLLGKLGIEAYEAFAAGKKSLGRTADVDALVKEVEAVRLQIDEKEEKLKK
jgi:hypothetical protein